MDNQVDFVRRQFGKIGSSLRCGNIEQAHSQLQSLEAGMTININPLSSAAQIHAGAVMIGELAETIDLKLLRKIYTLLKSLASQHVAHPPVRSVSLMLSFNVMYAYLQQGDIDSACAVFEDLSLIARNHAKDIDLLVGWTAAASNLVVALVNNGQVDTAVGLFDELLRIGTPAAGEPRWRKQFANVALGLLNAIGAEQNHWNEAISVLDRLDVLANLQPRDEALQHLRYGSYVGLITAAVNAGAYSRVVGMLETLQGA